MRLTDFRGATVVVTGHTGFKGSWLSAWLTRLGARVVGAGLDPVTEPSHFAAAKLGDTLEDNRLDIRDREALARIIAKASPDFVFHLAAQPLVRWSYSDPVETYETNVIGTLNVLEALRPLKKDCTAVMVTSDKAYLNKEWVWGYRETDELGGDDPYSASKGAAELVIRSHVRSFFELQPGTARIAVARAGNVVGGGDWAEDRIVPDCARAWSAGKSVELRNPHGSRPWQHVLEALSGYLALAMSLRDDPSLHGEPFNFGPAAEESHTVLELVRRLSENWKGSEWKDISGSSSGPHESALLKLNCDKALHRLGWRATLDFDSTVAATADWYRKFYARSAPPAEITSAQIDEFAARARKKGLLWAQ